MTRITDYDSLVTAIVDRMNDAALSDYAPEFIQMAEAMFNRRLGNLEMEGTATNTATASMALPTDFGAMKSIYLDTDPRQPLAPMTAAQIRHYWAAQTTGKPVNYALTSNEILLGPAPDDAYDVIITYVRTLEALTDINTTNWLLEKHPDLYLYGSLIHAEFRGWNDDRLPLLNNAVEGMIAEINVSGNRMRTATGLRMRPSAMERI